MRTHRSSKTSVDLQNSKFVEGLGILDFWEVIIRHDLVGSRRLDTIPVARLCGELSYSSMTSGCGDSQLLALSLLCQVAGEQIEE